MVGEKNMDVLKGIINGVGNYRDFQDLLTAYRISRVLMNAHELGIFEVLSHGQVRAGDICLKTHMDSAYGLRFLEVLTHLGFLENQDDRIGLTEFSRRFLAKDSNDYQGQSLEFEKFLFESWEHLAPTLCQGKRVYGVKEKHPDEYKAALNLYLGAMDNAARIRARELWDRIRPGQPGLILDAGAGSGAFLVEFLDRETSWRGIFCDLPDVIRTALSNPRIKPMLNRLSFRVANLLDDQESFSSVQANIILCSNLVHCQGKEETQGLLSRLIPALSDDGCLIVHDFFTDEGHRGALYDLHMMLNTYNGRTYSISDLCNMVKGLGLPYHRILRLESSSTALVLSRTEKAQGFIV